ncbi:MAG: glucose dehydrogenase [Rhizobiales bacterium]|nr:glucose dehydrogenase [Hyphomicrobiales bacterium]
MRRRSLSAAAVALVLAAVPLAAFPAPVQAAPDAGVVHIGTFDRPVYVTVAPGRPQNLFVVEQPGRIQILRNEVRLARPFLDLTDIVLSGSGEQGLLSVAFPPDYDSTGRFYVAFNNSDGDIEIDEFMRSAGRPVRADFASRRVVLVIPHRGASNHNGGQLQFGPEDGLLYISTGDGGNLSPRGEPARKLNNLLGKILRIDPRQRGSKAYRVPRSNPFVVGPGRGEIFAYGLRNPWRFSFDGKRIAIADVGQGRREEVNVLRTKAAAGVNFGWPQFEGDVVFDNDRPGPHPATFPILTYDHDGGGCAVIGGYVVHDPDIPSLNGRYLYGDACIGDVRSFIPKVPAQQARHDRATGINLPGLGSFGQGFNGRIYLAQTGGGVWRLIPPALP